MKCKVNETTYHRNSVVVKFKHSFVEQPLAKCFSYKKNEKDQLQFIAIRQSALHLTKAALSGQCLSITQILSLSLSLPRTLSLSLALTLSHALSLIHI